MQQPFPSEEVVEAAAAAVWKILRATPHIYNHSLRYIPARGQLEISRRAARAALFSAFVTAGDAGVEGLVDSLAKRVARRAEELTQAGDRIEKKNGHRPPWHRACGEIAEYSQLKRKYGSGGGDHA